MMHADQITGTSQPQSDASDSSAVSESVWNFNGIILKEVSELWWEPRYRVVKHGWTWFCLAWTVSYFTDFFDMKAVIYEPPSRRWCLLQGIWNYHVLLSCISAYNHVFVSLLLPASCSAEDQIFWIFLHPRRSQGHDLRDFVGSLASFS